MDGQEEAVALQANTGLTGLVQGLAVGDLRGQGGCRQEDGQAKGGWEFHARISLMTPVLSEKLLAGTPSDCRKDR